MQSALNTLLIDIYRTARGMASSRFKEAVFERLRAHLDFDAAGWGTFAITPVGAKVHSVHLHQLPMQMMVDYEAVKQHDTLSAKALSRPGHTINVSVDRTRWKLHPDMVAHTRKWGLDHALGTVHVHPVLNICNAISLYRGRRSAPFSPGERALKQTLTVHLVEAWNMNNMRYVERPSEEPDQNTSALALVDREGMIHNADTDLSALVCSEFPDWRGPLLPAPVVAQVCSGTPSAYRGKQVTFQQLRLSADGMVLVSVKPLSALNQLTARESAVAHLYAEGNTHKEIAAQLRISPATVRNQLQSVYRKLAIGSKIELAKRLAEAPAG